MLCLVKPPRDELVAEVLLAMIDTLRDDFDVADLLYTLTTACVELFDVDAAGILLIDQQHRLVPVAATHDGSDHLEQLQIMTREGPCLDAVHAVGTVHCDDWTRTPNVGRSSFARRVPRATGRHMRCRWPCAATSSVV